MNVWLIRMLCVFSFSYLALTFPFVYFHKGMDPVRQVDHHIDTLHSSFSSDGYVQLKNLSATAIDYVVGLRQDSLFKQRIAYGLAMFFNLMCFSLSFKLGSGALDFRVIKRGT